MFSIDMHRQSLNHTSNQLWPPLCKNWHSVKSCRLFMLVGKFMRTVEAQHIIRSCEL